ncbi:LOW QUALITY PROTEIN: hypothetical protein QTO34_003710 [Cnephaeus nilssonii]|uniref:Uncharacterized protein n=1 Tax=Cnephaeus nilssonii TaxID=3371016 RepID=A0AA40LJP2_CNENI|nr:LOW QUALITY PROTEIN: hypothetical protein QTO34_003710 [Eptesicus nilssonii]
MTVTGTAAGRTLRGVLRLLPVLWCWVFPADFLIVEMEAKIQTVLLNDNVTISCKVPGSTPLNTDITGVIWYVKHQAHGTEHKVFEMRSDRSQRVSSGVREGGLLTAPSWSPLRDAGEYRSSPECTLFREQAKVKDDGTNIFCARGFYPENIIIIWYTWTQENPQGQEISEGITTGPAIKNEDGTLTSPAV